MGGVTLRPFSPPIVFQGRKRRLHVSLRFQAVQPARLDPARPQQVFGIPSPPARGLAIHVAEHPVSVGFLPALEKETTGRLGVKRSRVGRFSSSSFLLMTRRPPRNGCP